MDTIVLHTDLSRCQTITTRLTQLGYNTIFLTAPHPIEGTPYTVARQSDYEPGDLERSWWTTDDEAGSHPNLSLVIATLRDAIKQHGPFAGALGFSQGGCAAASLAAMLEPSRRQSNPVRSLLGDDALSLQAPLELLILFSANPYRFPLSSSNDTDVRFMFYPASFTSYPYSKDDMPMAETIALLSRKSSSVYADSYPMSITTPNDNTISTPTLAFYGQKEWDLDPFSRRRQQWFISRFTDVQVQAHPWKHTVPRTDEYAKVVGKFVKRVEGRRKKPAKASL
jgi:Serine hydrolase (FSH1)